MLSVRQSGLAAALEEVGRQDACKIAGAVAPEARRTLVAALGGAAFQPAPEQVGDVRQDFDLLVVRPPLGSGDPGLAPLLAFSDEYAALLRAQAPDQPWLADFAATDIYVQRYGPGSRGISLHRDGRRFIKLISIFSLGDPAQFRLCRDRRGSPLRRYRLAAGDLLLLRAPGFAGRPEGGPLHAVSGPREEVRYSVSLRMERRADRAGGS
ncbi:hypothetical protein LCGC14_2039760 [marine sediment metagenome]|uniref:Fe2OG dioxygenase domain-containing protein n=1 Tax=marine sediment metagenome TaxID=412755 RepID=A0A0F9FET8_9ZZZZ